jgi:hypothetical protein
MMSLPYRIICEPEDPCRCADLSRICETGPPSRGFVLTRFALRAIAFTSVIIAAGMGGAAAQAVLAQPAMPIELGPSALAKLRRPFPGLMGYGYESHDPWELKKRALDLAEHHYDTSVIEVRLSDKLANRLRYEVDDLSGLDPNIKDGRLTSVFVTTGTPLGRAIGLHAGDEIKAINGWPVPLALSQGGDAQLLRSDQRMAVIEVNRGVSPMVFCVSWH